MKKIFARLLTLSLSIFVTFSLLGCNFKKVREFQTTTFQIGKDTYVKAIKADISGDQLTEKEIDILARNLFSQAAIVYKQTYFIAEEIELDDSNFIQSKIPTSIQSSANIDNTVYKWYKIAYIENWEDFKSICESFISSSFYQDTILPYAQNHIIENEGSLYQCNELVGGGGGSPNIVPTSKKIKVISQNADKIKIRACIKDAVLNDKNVNVDGDLEYTLINQNGYWVLEDFIGINQT